MTSLCFNIVLLSFLWLSACMVRTGDDSPVTVPLDLSDNRPVLELTIGGKGPYRFIMDTGSAGNVIDAGLAEEFGLEKIGFDTLRTPGSEEGLVSSRVQVTKIRISGSATDREAVMNVVELRALLPVDGILSTSFFTEQVITIDYAGAVLTLSDQSLDKNDPGVVPFIQKPRVINLEVDIDGNRVEAHLDTGNPGSIDLPFSLKDKLQFETEPSEAGVIRTPVATFKRWSATLSGNVGISQVVFENPEVSLVEGFEFANLGYRILNELRVTIDKGNHLIRFERSTFSGVRNEMASGESGGVTGWYGGTERRVFREDGELYLQRGGAPKLQLVQVSDNLYRMEFGMPVMNELPNVRFEGAEDGSVTGLTFLFEDGREEYVAKSR